MTAQTKQEHTAQYLYPGSFFPEETGRSISEATLAAAIAAAPDEEGYFRKDRWYALRIYTSTFKLFRSDDGDEEWVRQGKRAMVRSYVVGTKIHADDVPDTRDNSILISNIRCNSKTEHGVLTRAGNWQIADDYDEVIAAPQAVSA